MKSPYNLSMCAVILLCSYGCYEEPGRNMMALREVGMSENNLYSIENLKPDGTAICYSLREYTNNGEIVGSMNRSGNPIVDLSEKDVDKLRNLKNKINLTSNSNGSINYKLIFWDGEANPQEEGFFDGSSGVGLEIVNFTKNKCQTNWPAPN